MQQFWIRILIILSSVLSVHAALAAPLSTLLNGANKTPSLSVDSSLHSQFSVSLAEIVQHKAVALLVKELQQLTNLKNECSPALTRIIINATYTQHLHQQKSVYSAVQARSHSCFKSQTSYQAERQKIALQTSKFN